MDDVHEDETVGEETVDDLDFDGYIMLLADMMEILTPLVLKMEDNVPLFWINIWQRI